MRKILLIALFLMSFSAFADNYPSYVYYMWGSWTSPQNACNAYYGTNPIWPAVGDTQCQNPSTGQLYGPGFQKITYHTCQYGGGTMSSDGTWTCLNAPACVAPQVRNAITGACGLPQKSNGRSSCGVDVENPINASTGNKWQHETDFSSKIFGLGFDRYYNASTTASPSNLGAGWSHAYSRSGTLQSTGALISMQRNDGKAYNFQSSAGLWVADADVPDHLEELKNSSNVRIGWRYTTADHAVETYTAAGQLTSIADRSGLTQTLTYSDASTPVSVAPVAGLLLRVTDTFGHQLNFTYDANSRIATLTDPAGSVYHYGYDANNNLVSVTYPDGTSKAYLYENASFPHALTGITDENGTRFATYTYDTQGRGLSTEHAGGVDRASLTYNADGSTTVIDALNTSRTYQFQTLLGVFKSKGQSQPGGSGCGASASALSYDANGNIISRTDFNGNVSCYAYDTTRNLETARVEGLAPGKSCPTNIAAYTPTANSSERVITTSWNASYRLPAQINEAGRQTVFAYDAAGNLLSKTVTDTATGQSRTWAYTYNSLGQVLTEDGPRTDVADVTTYAYYSDSTASHKPGDLQSQSNALGHTTQYTAYDANGRLLSLTDPNGLVVSLTYDTRGRLTSKTIGGNTTAYSYDAAGNLTKITRPTGVTVSYTYDAAHRLIGITDALGGKLHYTLDALGNRTQDVVTDALGNTVKTHTRQYDALSRLQQDIGAYNQTVSYQYDANGNVTQITDANNHVTRQAYDSLNRLVQATDALNGLTDFYYDAQDRLTEVTDAANHSTVYSYNGLGNLTQLSSPNTGITQYSYDSAGNLAQKTDANNSVGHYSYDVLNRLTAVTYTGNDASANVVNSYDGAPGNGANQKGRLTAAQRGAVTTTYTYDLFGNLASITGFALPHPGSGNTIGYSYNADNRVTDIAFATYRDIQYQYDAAGQVSQIAVHDADNGAFSTGGYNVTRLLASNIQHLPFGPASSLIYGNGLTLSRSYDRDYRLTGQTVGSLQNRTYGYDANGNLQTANDLITAANSQSFGYDALNRLINASGPNSFAYLYDSVGNRTLDVNNTATTQYYYDLNSQKLLSQAGARPDTILTDAAGNVTQSRGNTYGYAPDQRLATVLQGTSTIATYSYNPQGQRIAKTTGSSTTNFDYDLQGRLLEENDIPGNYVYLDGEPLARVDYNLSDTSGNVAAWNIAFYHNNPVGAPVQTTDQNGNVSWTGQLDPFGSVLPINPNITQNLRFPGQYFDQETGLHYNYFRDYDPSTGRYIESDPIGLTGGINTYTYVSNNPLRYIDSLGLEQFGIGIESPSARAIANGVLDPSIDPGHTFAYLATDSGSIISVYSMGPAHTVAFNKESFLNSTLGAVSDWPLNGKINTYKWKISGDQFSQCKSAFDAKKANPGNYSPTNQCTSSAIALANQCGINVPSGVSPVAIPAIPYVFDGYNNNLPNPYGLQQQLNQSMAPVVVPSNKFPAGGQ